MLQNSDIEIDWMFRLSFANDVAKVCIILRKEAFNANLMFLRSCFIAFAALPHLIAQHHLLNKSINNNHIEISSLTRM